MIVSRYLHDKARDIRAFRKRRYLNIFVEFSNRIEKEMQLLRDDIKDLKEENRQLIISKIAAIAHDHLRRI